MIEIKQSYRGVTWTMTPVVVSGTWITFRVHDRTHLMIASVIDFSLWDATCKQIPDLTLSDANIETLGKWLKANGSNWRLGWGRKTRATKAKLPPPADPRQLSLFEDE